MNKSTDFLYTAILTLVVFLCLPLASMVAQINFTTHFLTPSPGATTDRPAFVVTFDVENDGDVDIISASFRDDKIAWYENDGQQNFVQHIITTNANGVSALDTVDMEGDGDMDLLSDAAVDDKIYWYENDGQGTFTPHVIYSNQNSPFEFATYSVRAKDIDSDGDMDAVHGGWHDKVLKWHENDGSNLNFTSHVIDTLGERYTVFAKDLDGDHDVDVLATCQYPSVVVWYENDGNQNFTKHSISNSPTFPRIIIAIDLDKDDDIDVVTANYEGNVKWFENDGQQNFTTHSIPGSPTCNVIYVADMDNDNDLDIMTGDPDSNPAINRIGWLENDGQQNFTYHIITTEVNWPSSIWGGDVDSDGDMDVVYTSLYTASVAWCESGLISPVGISETAAIPSAFALAQNYPNPFNPATTIEFSLPTSSMVTLAIYNIRGQNVAELISETLPAGNHSVSWDGRDIRGNVLSTGIYFYHITAGDFTAVKKMIFLR